MNYVGLICARGGSKGLPGKNIRMLAGIPLIGWAIRAAKDVPRISRVIVSTDSEEIAAVARKHGGEVPFMRPAALAGDNSPEWMTWRHALDYLQNTEGEKIDGLVSVPATAPLRSSRDIENCLDEYERDEVDAVITVTESHRSPFFNMVKHDEEGNASLVISLKENFVRRQDVPEVFDMTTVAYVMRPEFVRQHDALFEGRVRSVFVPTERAIDIDTNLDFQIAELLLSRKQVIDL